MTLRPMLATLAEPPLTGAGLVYEPKYDGIRALVEITGSGAAPRVTIWSRNGNDKTHQFPAIAAALRKAAVHFMLPVIIDGEVVALDARGRPAGFQRLQGRIHLSGAQDVERIERPTAKAGAHRAPFARGQILHPGEHAVPSQ